MRFYNQLLIVILLLTFVSFSCTQENSQVAYCECQTWEGWSNQEDIKCGFVTVPEDHDSPGGRKIKVAFAIFESQSQEKSLIPTLILTGGPGGRALNNPARGENHESRAVGDVIIVEQRGIGLSSALPDLSDEGADIIAMDLDTMQERILTREAMIKKVEEIKKAGIDPSKYNSTQNAKDFGVLMNSLDYEKYNLYGTSYGTKLGITIMKYFAPKINAAILDGPAALNNKALEGRFPDLKRSLNLLFERCASDTLCYIAHPDLKREMIKAIKSLKENPVTVNILNKDFTINPQDALFFIRYLLYRPTAFETAPRFIKAINDRDLAAISELGEFPVRMLHAANTSMFYSFNLYEDYSDATPGNVRIFSSENEELEEGLAWFQAFIPSLSVWHNGRVTKDEAKYENINVPTLVITNDFDPVTPPYNTKFFEDALTNEQVLRLNRFGHGSGGNCIAQIRNAFLKNPSSPIDESCLNEAKQ